MHHERLARFYRLFYNERRWEEAAPLLHPEFRNHHPGAKGVGPAGMIDDFSRLGPPPEFRITPQRMVTDGDLVWVISCSTGVGNGGLSVDIWRFEDDLIVEHWDVFRRLDPTEDIDRILARLPRGDQTGKSVDTATARQAASSPAT